MGYCLDSQGLDAVLDELRKTHVIFAPKRYRGQGEFSDTDSIRYGEISSAAEIELIEKSSHSFKEVLLPISETLFFFTEENVKEANIDPRNAIVFLRSCDLHAVKRLDEIYLKNGTEDYYYKRLREKIKFVLIGCATAFDNCFCVDMETNVSEDYSLSLDMRNSLYYLNCKTPAWDNLLTKHAKSTLEVTPDYVSETKTRVTTPHYVSAEMMNDEMWDEYDSRCIACGRCNFSCPTCTCFTMQDVFYTDNGKVGERRRVWASCMVDGFSDVAGGGSYRQKHGQRMRFKVLHKVFDYKERFGYHMCVGCGRCDDVCPEYISFSHAVNKLSTTMNEVCDK